MKGSLSCIMSLLSLLSLNEPRADAQTPAAVVWQDLIATKGQRLVFDASDSSMPPWPKVCSPQQACLLQGIDTNEQTVFLSIATAVLQDAKACLDKGSVQKDEQRWQRCLGMLQCRDAISKGGGYVNLLLGDVLTRTCLVILCEEMGSARVLDSYFEKCLSRLASSQMSIDPWLTLAKEELNWPIEKINPVKDESNEEAEFKKFCLLLTGRDSAQSVDMKGSKPADDLLKTQDVVSLFSRCAFTDYQIETISLAAQYRKQAPEFSVGDPCEKIDQVCPWLRPGDTVIAYRAGGKIQTKIEKAPLLDQRRPLRMGERLLGYSPYAYNVWALFQTIESGKILQFPRYSSSYPSE